MSTPPVLAASVSRGNARGCGLARIGAALALALAGGVFLYQCRASPSIAYLSREGRGAWITYPSPSNPVTHRFRALDAVFRRDFRLSSLPPVAVLRIRAFRDCRLLVNGRLLDLGTPGTAWKTERRVDVAPFLQPGANRLEVIVSNTGPPALWLQLELPGETLLTDERWEVSWAGASWRAAARASDSSRGRRVDPRGVFPSPISALRTAAPTLLGFALLCAAAALGVSRLWSRHPRALDRWLRSGWPLRAAVICATLLWTALFLNNLQLPLEVGFDAPSHLEYVRYLLEHGALPGALHGWQTYQPPLYYLLAAAAVRLGSHGLEDPGATVALRVIGLGAGLLTLVAVAAAMRLLFPASPRRQLLGFVVAAFYPGLLLLCHYPTNEALFAALASLCILLTLRMVRSERPPVRDHLILGGCIGLALLAKVSALLLVPFALGAVGLDSVRRVGEARLARGARALAFLATVAAVCGWFYWGLWSRQHTVLLTNAVTKPYWQDPGFRTIEQFTSFGAVLGQPMFAGLHGFWDGLYSTAWGDGLASGSDRSWALPWRLDLMSVGYLLALVPTGAAVVGFLVVCWRWLRSPDPTWTVAIGVALLTAAAMVEWSLVVAGYSTIKAVFGLCALIPFVAFTAVGLDLIMGVRRWLAAVLAVALGTWALTAYRAAWIDDSAGARAALGVLRLERGEVERGVTLLRQAIAREPDNWTARLALASAMLDLGAPRNQIEAVLGPARERKDVAAVHVATAALAHRSGAVGEALAEAGRAVELDPDDMEALGLLARSQESRGLWVAAAGSWREYLRVDPFAVEAHQALAITYARLGEPESSAAHQRYLAVLSR